MLLNAHHLLPPETLQHPVFPLRSSELYDLQVYAYLGSTLPTDRDDYRCELGLTTEELKEFELNVDGILSVYKDIRTHTRDFRSDVFPEIVRVAATVAEYSESAPSYYERILESIMKSATTKSNDTLHECLNQQIASTDALEGQTRIVIGDIERFNKDTCSDLERLVREDKKLDHRLGGYQANAVNLEEKKKELQRKEDLRQHGINAILKWIDKHKRSVKEIINEMAKNDSELKLYLSLKSRGEDMARDLKKLYDLAQSAIKILNNILAAFGQIAKSLRYIKEQAQFNIYDDPDLSDIHIDSVKVAWVNLGERARQYMTEAFVVISDHDG